MDAIYYIKDYLLNYYNDYVNLFAYGYSRFGSTDYYTLFDVLFYSLMYIPFFITSIFYLSIINGGGAGTQVWCLLKRKPLGNKRIRLRDFFLINGSYLVVLTLFPEPIHYLGLKIACILIALHSLMCLICFIEEYVIETKRKQVVNSI